MRRPLWGIANVILQILDIILLGVKIVAERYSTRIWLHVKQNNALSAKKSFQAMIYSKKGAKLLTQAERSKDACKDIFGINAAYNRTKSIERHPEVNIGKFG